MYFLNDVIAIGTKLANDTKILDKVQYLDEKNDFFRLEELNRYEVRDLDNTKLQES